MSILVVLWSAVQVLAASHPEYLQSRHSILVRHADGHETRLHLSHLTDNGPEKPGLFFLTDHNGGIASRLDVPLEVEWKSLPKSELARTSAERRLRNLNADYPHHVTLGTLQGEDAARELLTFLETTRDAYDLIYTERKEYKKVRRRVHRDSTKSGEKFVAVFNHVEREIPAREVLIRNRSTGEVRKLTDFTEVLLAKKLGNDEFLKDRIGAFLSWMGGKPVKKSAPTKPKETAYIERSFVPVKTQPFYTDHQEYEYDWRKGAWTRQPGSGDAR